MELVTIDIISKKGVWTLNKIQLPDPHHTTDREILEIPEGKLIHVIQLQKGEWQHIRTDH